MPPKIEILSSVRQMRVGRGWSQAELAERVGVSRQTMNYIEQGGYCPSVALALRIASVFGCSVEDIFSLPPDNKEVS